MWIPSITQTLGPFLVIVHLPWEGAATVQMLPLDTSQKKGGPLSAEEWATQWAALAPVLQQHAQSVRLHSRIRQWLTEYHSHPDQKAHWIAKRQADLVGHPKTSRQTLNAMLHLTTIDPLQLPDALRPWVEEVLRHATSMDSTTQPSA